MTLYIQYGHIWNYILVIRYLPKTSPISLVLDDLGGREIQTSTFEGPAPAPDE